jgi:hypothetical protein
MVEHPRQYSCVVINSVIQYLPSIEALLEALASLIKATQSNGSILIGDVRSFELMDVYLLEKMRANSADTNEMQAHLSSLYYKSRDAEIVLSPQFFYTSGYLCKTWCLSK